MPEHDKSETSSIKLWPPPRRRTACGGSHCVARFRLGSLASHPPRWGSPKPRQHRITSTNFSVDHAAPRIGLTTALVGIVAQYTAHSAISAARLAN